MNRLRAGTPIVVEDVEVIPIELTRFSADRLANGLAGFAAKSPTAVVIRSRQGVWALGLDGQPVSLHDLRREVPGLEELVTRPLTLTPST